MNKKVFGAVEPIQRHCFKHSDRLNTLTNQSERINCSINLGILYTIGACSKGSPGHT